MTNYLAYMQICKFNMLDIILIVMDSILFCYNLTC